MADMTLEDRREMDESIEDLLFAASRMANAAYEKWCKHRLEAGKSSSVPDSVYEEFGLDVNGIVASIDVAKRIVKIW